MWQRMLTGQITAVQAAAEAGVDRSTVMALRKTARDGAIAALQASRPGRPKGNRAEASELAGLRVEVVRLSATIVEQAIELGKVPLGTLGAPAVANRLKATAVTTALPLDPRMVLTASPIQETQARMSPEHPRGLHLDLPSGHPWQRALT